MSFKTFVKADIKQPQYEHNPDHFSFLRYMEDDLYRKYFDETDFSHYYSSFNTKPSRFEYHTKVARSRGKQIKHRDELLEKFYSAETRPKLRRQASKAHTAAATTAAAAVAAAAVSTPQPVLDSRLKAAIKSLDDTQKVFINKHINDGHFISVLERNTIFKVARNLFCVDFKKDEESKANESFGKAVDIFLKKKVKGSDKRKHLKEKMTLGQMQKDFPKIKAENVIKAKNDANNVNPPPKVIQKDFKNFFSKVNKYFNKVQFGNLNKKIRQEFTIIIKAMRKNTGWNAKKNWFKANPKSFEEGYKYAMGLMNKTAQLFKTAGDRRRTAGDRRRKRNEKVNTFAAKLKAKAAKAAALKAKAAKAAATKTHHHVNGVNFQQAEGLTSFRKWLNCSDDPDCGGFVRKMLGMFASFFVGAAQIALTMLALAGFCMLLKLWAALFAFEMSRYYIMPRSDRSITIELMKFYWQVCGWIICGFDGCGDDVSSGMKYVSSGIKYLTG